MKKVFISIALVAASLLSINAQSKLSENTTLSIACETPIGIENKNAATIVENNIKQALVLNGLSATESRFTSSSITHLQPTEKEKLIYKV